ncbi:hypothetical protein ACMDCR_22450 [Labrys okinawensis]|uniref:hypothetical protein n=1 Tax=Labrys okinawensis TaxID=346911 RepID=UPI0039BD1398
MMKRANSSARVIQTLESRIRHPAKGSSLMRRRPPENASEAADEAFKKIWSDLEEFRKEQLKLTESA